MTHDNLKDIFREGVVEKSIQILRKNGKSDGAIREMMLNDFVITEENLEQIMKTS